jgi:pimeloyl-ACP methyl ester carboxylesterase
MQQNLLESIKTFTTAPWLTAILLLPCLLPSSGPGCTGRLYADGPSDNDPRTVRLVPPAGVDVSAGDRQLLDRELGRLAAEIEQLRARNDDRTQQLLPDVMIFHRAVDTALQHGEFFAEKEIERAQELLAVGRRRAAELLAGTASWTSARGLVVRGYVSRIDHTVQPYGLVIPENYVANGELSHRLDIWFHGRGERTGEIGFLTERMAQVGPYAPAGTIVLHPYGRYSNAFKFAGEVDVLEALEATRQQYRVDEDRISVRGFSMGGAACWQFAVHYPDHWFAANPGAGFSETPLFLESFQKETLRPTWFERKLWQWYDCPGYALNLLHCPTVAYSGEVDVQKQAADVMQQALAGEGIDLVHVIGPQTAHAIHPAAKREIEHRLHSLAVRGRDRWPMHLEFQTFTLKYNQIHWLTIDALQRHWEPTRVTADFDPTRAQIDLATKNIGELSLTFPAGSWPSDLRKTPRLRIDGTSLDGPLPKSDRSWQCRLRFAGGVWQVAESLPTGMRKQHGLQGPIDDAFMDSFVFVRPTQAGVNPQVDEWAAHELQRAIAEWRRHFRGDARVVDDGDVTPELIRSANLVVFGTPASNRFLARLMPDLPARWDEKRLQVAGNEYDADFHVPLLIYPDPLNPDRYVVLNSGFTFREYAYLNNARQVPMLPDWAVVDVRQPPTTQFPGRIADADFFDEHWQFRAR